MGMECGEDLREIVILENGISLKHMGMVCMYGQMGIDTKVFGICA
jgi:hypothetical protein